MWKNVAILSQAFVQKKQANREFVKGLSGVSRKYTFLEMVGMH